MTAVLTVAGIAAALLGISVACSISFARKFDNALHPF